uniref:Uncharacterized protein n=1 Tax=Arundo donax TaxID=35708 RepID=A0A0A9CG63_ARUDO
MLCSTYYSISIFNIRLCCMWIWKSMEYL